MSFWFLYWQKFIQQLIFRLQKVCFLQRTRKGKSHFRSHKEGKKRICVSLNLQLGQGVLSIGLSRYSGTRNPMQSMASVSSRRRNKPSE